MSWEWVWWAAAAVLGTAILWPLTRRSRTRRGGDSAEEILNRRFARGEITRSEYEEKLAALRK
ncbi:MAG TPA: SHOCT domain-containing protein [Polyangiaceae bacterium]|nr:SHOCT domain-containing protein [Polyangiaceae bacterium]